MDAAGAYPAWQNGALKTLSVAGDMLYASAANTLARLAKGAEGKLLRQGASFPAWTTLTMPTTIAAGSVFAANAANVLSAITSITDTKYLKNTAGVISWGALATTVGGSDTQVQFNDAGVFGGDAGLTYSKTSNLLTAGAYGLTDGTFIMYSTNTGSASRGRVYVSEDWKPAVQVGGTWNYHNFRGIECGLSSRAGKSAAELWNTSNNIDEIYFSATTDVGYEMYGSHVCGYNSYGYIPAGLADGGGSHADAQHFELGGFTGALWALSPGHYLEGIGQWVCDGAPSTTSPSVATLMTGAAIAVQKSNASNAYASVGVSIGSIGAQQTTYAPTVGLKIWGGWQAGIDMSSMAYGTGIKMGRTVIGSSIIEYDNDDYSYFWGNTFAWMIGGVAVLVASAAGSQINIGGVLKTLSVDGSGFVKAT
jgi:hypothetical protein